MDEKTDLLNETAIQRQISGWEYHLALRSAASLRAKNRGGFKLTAAYLLPGYDEKQLENMEKNLLSPPVQIGRTLFKNFLLRPDMWEEKFWNLVDPANYHRLFSMHLMTEQICEKVRLSKIDWRAPTIPMSSPQDAMLKMQKE